MFGFQEEVDKLSNNFNSLINPDTSIRVPAQQFIDQKMAADPLHFITLCAGILNQDGFHPSCYFYSLFFIGRRLTPNYLVKLEVIRESWMKFDNRDFIKDAIFRGLLFPHKTISNEASHTFAKLFSIEGIEMLPLIGKLFILIQSNEYSMETHLAGVNTLHEICDENILGQMTGSDEVRSCLIQIFDFIGKLFLNINNTDEMKISLCKVLDSLISIASPLFEVEAVFNGFVIMINNYLVSGPSVEFHLHLIQLLISLTKTLYFLPSFNFNEIGTITVKMIHVEQNRDKLLNVLEFWNQITKFEVLKVRRLRFEQKYRESVQEIPSSISNNMQTLKSPPLLNISIQAIPEIAKKLIEFLAYMPSDETEPEDPNKPTGIHVKAFQCLSNMYELNPKPIYDLILKFWKANNPCKSSYPVQHALLLTIAIVTRAPLTSAQENDVLNFLTKNPQPNTNFTITGFLLKAIKLNEKRMVDTALYVISMVLENYNIYMSHESLEILVKLMSNCLFIHPVITERIFYVIDSIILRCCNHGFIRLLEEFYDSLMLFCNNVINHMGFPESTLRACHITMGYLIFYAPDSKYEVVEEILTKSIETISQQANFSIDQNSISTIIDNIYNVSICFRRFKERFKKCGVKAAKALFNAMKRISSIFEESLSCIICIIASLESDASEIFNEILPCIEFALTLQSPSVITTTLTALGELYSAILSDSGSVYAKELITRLPSTFDLIYRSLYNFNFTRELNTTILRSLAKVIKASAKEIQINDRDKLAHIYNEYLNTPLDYRKEEDVKYAALLYRAVIEGFEALLHTVRNEELNIRIIKRDFMAIVPKVISMPEQSPECLRAICQMFITFNEVYKNQGNIILNRAANYQLVLYAKCISIPSKKMIEIELSRLAKETFDIMKNA